MKLQAVNPAMSTIGCQPVKPVNFEKKQSSNLNENNQNTSEQFDSFTLEQKYDMACRVAAYYKTQYEQLLKDGACLA